MTRRFKNPPPRIPRATAYEDLYSWAEHIAAREGVVKNVSFHTRSDHDDVEIRFEVSRGGRWAPETIRTAHRFPEFTQAVLRFDGYAPSFLSREPSRRVRTRRSGPAPIGRGPVPTFNVALTDADATTVLWALDRYYENLDPKDPDDQDEQQNVRDALDKIRTAHERWQPRRG